MIRGKVKHKDEELDYEVVKWIKRDEYTPHDQKLRTRIDPDQLGEAEAVYVKINQTDGTEEYRYFWGPFFDGVDELEQHIEDSLDYEY